ncbi:MULTISPECIES: hypothetical protein [unclassified Rhizobacter]|uniref:hypothetical protein n=1 Tax=unclassified Rhizobacter TaxID=2640088 RepID=UPI0006F45577|nr:MULTISPECIES: hypothetical protein [unclassified Rhizobacter]KQU64578.1 hypothetical protein ASC88_12910 [Rhizobacter sp. Root29]KQW03397.1 hypothetical protein ASC98_27665 [Rhizobacter sp. Root1238]
MTEAVSTGDSRKSDSARGSADVCTDPDCFAEKKKVHLLRVVPRAAEGAAAATPQPIKHEPAAQHAEPAAPTGDASDRDAHEAAAANVASAPSDMEADQTEPAAVPPAKPVRVQRRKAIDEDATPSTLACRNRLDLLKRVRERALATERSAFDLRLVAKFVCESIAWRHRATLEGLYDCGVGNLAARIDTLQPSEIALFLLDCALATNVMVGEGDAVEQPSYLLAAAEHYLSTPTLPTQPTT